MLKSQPEILGLGSPIFDLIAHVDEDFLSTVKGRKGGMELIDEATFKEIVGRLPSKPEYVPGGSTANLLRTLAHLDHRCALIGKIGQDMAGKTFTDILKALGIENLCDQVSKPTAQVISLVTPDGQRTCRTYIGAAADIRPKDLTKPKFKGMRLLHIEGYALDNLPLVEKAMSYGKDVGAKISLDLASFEIVERHKNSIFHLLNRYVDILFCNAEEALALTGLPPEEACGILKEICSLVVVSMNKDGCWVGKEYELLKCDAYPATPLDSTGAGDFFAGGFLHGYLLGHPLLTCAHYGALLGAAVVQYQGADLPHHEWQKIKEEILKFAHARGAA